MSFNDMPGLGSGGKPEYPTLLSVPCDCEIMNLQLDMNGTSNRNIR